MKSPKYPIKPQKQSPDCKTILYEVSSCSQLSLSSVMEFFPKDIPLDDVFISSECESDYGDSCYHTLTFFYFKKIDYEKEEASYNEKMKKYDKEMLEYKKKLKLYKEYQKKNAIQKLEVKLEKLKLEKLKLEGKSKEK
jgi:hypothetical protein